MRKETNKTSDTLDTNSLLDRVDATIRPIEITKRECDEAREIKRRSSGDWVEMVIGFIGGTLWATARQRAKAFLRTIEEREGAK
jgi:hypothetical protein